MEDNKDLSIENRNSTIMSIIPHLEEMIKKEQEHLLFLNKSKNTFGQLNPYFNFSDSSPLFKRNHNLNFFQIDSAIKTSEESLKFYKKRLTQYEKYFNSK